MYDDPHTCSLNKRHLRFSNPAVDVRIYEARVSAERMERMALRLGELGGGSELAREVEAKHGKRFMDRLRVIWAGQRRVAA